MYSFRHQIDSSEAARFCAAEEAADVIAAMLKAWRWHAGEMNKLYGEVGRAA